MNDDHKKQDACPPKSCCDKEKQAPADQATKCCAKEGFKACSQLYQVEANKWLDKARKFIQKNPIATIVGVVVVILILAAIF